MSSEEAHPPRTEPSGELVPPSRPPPTAVGAGIPEPPIHVPHQHVARRRPRSGVLRFIADTASEYVGLLAAAAARLVHATTRTGRGRHA
jgi:hypothetical protein